MLISCNAICRGAPIPGITVSVIKSEDLWLGPCFRELQARRCHRQTSHERSGGSGRLGFLELPTIARSQPTSVLTRKKKKSHEITTADTHDRCSRCSPSTAWRSKDEVAMGSMKLGGLPTLASSITSRTSCSTTLPFNFGKATLITSSA